MVVHTSLAVITEDTHQRGLCCVPPGLCAASVKPGAGRDGLCGLMPKVKGCKQPFEQWAVPARVCVHCEVVDNELPSVLWETLV